MILQNKKTGVLGVLEATTYHGGRPDNIIEVYEMGMGAVRVLAQYKTLEELLGEWEDYEPKGPLIKDEKIRKAVRAWAEANKTNHVWVSVASDGINITQDEQYPPSTKYKQSITFECEAEFKSEYYTIEELCGEEEE